MTTKQIKDKINKFYEGTGYKVKIDLDTKEKVATVLLNKGNVEYSYSVSYKFENLFMDSFKTDGYKDDVYRHQRYSIDEHKLIN